MQNNRRKALNVRYHQLCSILKLSTDEKKKALKESTGFGTNPQSSTELSDRQLAEVIKSFEARLETSLKRMRAKAINLARSHQLVTGELPNVDWTGLNNFTQKTFKKKFYELSYNQLRDCITALEKWKDYNQTKAIKELCY